MKQETRNKRRSLHAIAEDIRADWKKISMYASPYLEAMEQLDQITDNYG